MSSFEKKLIQLNMTLYRKVICKSHIELLIDKDENDV